jgi:hypothetical protein
VIRRHNFLHKRGSVRIRRSLPPRSSPGSCYEGLSRVTFHEVRTQRQWSELAILRTTPALLALFSLVTIFASQLLEGQALPIRQAAWYSKALPTFSDTFAFVREHLWPATLSSLSPAKPDMVEIPRALFERLTQTLAFVA